MGLFLGALLSGLLAGILSGFAALIPEPARWVAAGLTVLPVLAFELAGRPLSLPQNRRAVPQTVIPESNTSGPLQFGFEMGTGLRTFMPTALPHALLLAVALVGDIGTAVLAGLGFGLGRALMPLTRARAAAPRDWDVRLFGSLRSIGIVCASGFVLAAAVIVLHGLRAGGWGGG